MKGNVNQTPCLNAALECNWLDAEMLCGSFPT